MKRTSSEILSEIVPLKSKSKYDKRWEEYKEYIGNNEPSEENLIQFFDYLRKEKHYECSTIWSIYSMINSKMQLNHGLKLQNFSRITALLKSYEVGYIRKTAKTFTQEQFQQFLRDAPNTGSYIQLKVGIIIAYCGGLRCADLTNINCEDLNFNENTGMWVKYRVSKQRGEVIENQFNIPLDLCEYLQRYDDDITENNVGEGRLFKCIRFRKNGQHYYTRQPMGIHIISKFSCKMAEFLNLENPNAYTGHSLRRSSATLMAESGTSTEVMKKHFNWRSQGTCSKYVDRTKKSQMDISKIFSKAKSDEEPKRENSKVVRFENCSHVIINF